MARAEADGSEVRFTVHLTIDPGAPLSAVRGFQRALEDYAAEHELTIDGTQLRFEVAAGGRAVTADDQVALLDWLIDRPAIRLVRLGALQKGRSGPAGHIDVSVGDLTLVGVTLLYRLGRLGAEQYLKILGGFVRPDVH